MNREATRIGIIAGDCVENVDRHPAYKEVIMVSKILVEKILVLSGLTNFMAV